MRRLTLFFFFIQAVSLLAAERPTWSLYATKLSPCVSVELMQCHPPAGSSHDGKTVTLRTFSKGGDLDGELAVETRQGGTLPLSRDAEWNVESGVDALWSPGSRFLAVTGGLNAYTESTRVYEVTSSGVNLLGVFREATADMLQSFPPCKALNVDREDCERQERDPFFNFAAIAWSGPSSLVVMAEIPCSGSYGSFMCQVEGYEIDVRTGHILHRMNASQFKGRWQHAMAWNFRVPEPARSVAVH
jgi:hypothetical protein